MLKYVVKRDGTLEEFNVDKLNKWAEWASETCGVSWSDVLLEASRQLHDQVDTTDIHKCLIDVCVNRKDTGHSRMAARLFVGQIYKEAFQDFSIPSMVEFYSEMVSSGYWRDLGYTEEELQEIDSAIDHTLDLTYEYCTIRQFYDKYAVSAYGRCLESPQMALMGVAMSNTADENNRVKSAIDLYKTLSALKANLPTPSLSGQRTVQSGSPSCCLISGGDSVDSVEAAVHVAYKMTALSSGIGAEFEIRGPKDPVKGGTIEHQGKMAYYRYLDRAVKANRQHCYSSDTEVMTDKGWKKFYDLEDSDLVAQVTDERAIEFVKPLNKFEYDFDGEMVHLHRRGFDLLVTDNHVVPFRRVSYDNKSIQRNEGYEEMFAKDVSPSRTKVFDFGGVNTKGVDEITASERLYIAFCADGSKYFNKDGTFSYKFGFKRARKVERLTKILEDVGLEYTVKENEKSGVTTVRVLASCLNMDKGLTDLYDVSISSKKAMEWLNEISFWDSYKRDEANGTFEFGSYRQEEHIVQWLSAMAGVSSYTGTEKRCKVFRAVTDRTFEEMKKDLISYSGKVYCVEVPSNKLVVRRNGYQVVCGNSRGGSATVTFTALDPEIDTLLRLKSQRVHHDQRIDTMDYSLGVVTSLLRRAAKDEDWMLVSCWYAPKLYELLYQSNVETFDEEYDKVASDPKAKKQFVKAREVVNLFFSQRSDTGRIYKTNLTNVNTHTPFKEPVRLSNLC